MKITFVYSAFESLGLESLSAVLKKEGYQTELVLDPSLFDDTFVKYTLLAKLFSYKKQVIRQILNSQPDLVTFSIVSDNYAWACDIARELKSLKDIPIVFGGIHATSMPEVIINNPFVDFVIVGEAEYALRDLVENIKEKKKGCDIENIWWKNEGKIIANPVRSLIPNLDEIPFVDKDLYYKKIPYYLKRGIYTIMTGRGCIFNCTYCNNNLLKKIYKDKGNYTRRRSVDNVIEELKIAKSEYKSKAIIFHDETFAYDKQWLREFIQKYRQDIALPFFCWVNAGTIDEEVAKLLSSAGCFEVQMGVQTISEKTRRDILNRYETNAQITDAIRFLKKNHISVTTDNMFGLPGQGGEELLDLARFYNENRVDLVGIYWLRYYPRTDIINIARKYDMLDEEDVKRIEGCQETRAFIVGGDTYNSAFAQIQKLIYLSQILPKSLARAIVDKGLYKFIPFSASFALNSFISRLRSRLFGSKKRYPIFESYVRYAYFMPRKFAIIRSFQKCGYCINVASKEVTG